ncbi:unnamed protein product [Cyberlindnera jadinii]|uniref:Thioesterase domain-containing protein n=1 Tax=Cyberlindnera jadinii (strain ATCC 18201 / CBS 1600 / BCRC 20928 / JCM 3617 / NBRC 0987 / NRRL Y-1542) TaxID=983966 RepID=A0A0H5C520_CYBJN|nr:unnamed protein product [Cyberlindnera jadinii]
MSTFLGKTLLSTAAFATGFAVFARPWKEDSRTVNTRSLDEQRLDIIKDIKNTKGYELLVNDRKFAFDSHSSRIPKTYRHQYVSQGLFFGPRQLEIDPLVFVNNEDNELQAYYHIGDKMASYDGKIHNGVLSTMIDESLSFCGFPCLPSKRGVTAKLSIEFLDHVQPDSTIVLKAKVRESKGRKVIIDGHIETVADKPVKIAQAECILVEPKWFKYFTWLSLF